MRLSNLYLLAGVLALVVSTPAQAIVVDDFSMSDPAAGFSLLLNDGGILESHLETGLPNGNVLGGARHVQVDWQGIPLGLGPFPGDTSQVDVNVATSPGVARMTVNGDPRFVYSYGRGAGLANAWTPMDISATDNVKVTLGASIAEDLTFGAFIYGELFGRTQLWASTPFNLVAGNIDTVFDIPQAVTFTAFDTSNVPHVVPVGDLLEHTTGMSLEWVGYDNPDAITTFDLSLIELVAPGCSKPGDFDGDGDVDADDIDILCDNMGGDPLEYDLDGDNDVDEDDFVYLIENLVELTDGSGRTGTKRGDFNLDGLINATDLAIMKPNFGFSPRKYAQGNANCDDLVNATDLAILAANFGYIAPPAPVPEPVSLTLLACGGLAALRRRR